MLITSCFTVISVSNEYNHYREIFTVKAKVQFRQKHWLAHCTQACNCLRGQSWLNEQGLLCDGLRFVNTVCRITPASVPPKLSLCKPFMVVPSSKGPLCVWCWVIKTESHYSRHIFEDVRCGKEPLHDRATEICYAALCFRLLYLTTFIAVHFNSQPALKLSLSVQQFNFITMCIPDWLTFHAST